MVSCWNWLRRLECRLQLRGPSIWLEAFISWFLAMLDEGRLRGMKPPIGGSAEISLLMKIDTGIRNMKTKPSDVGLTLTAPSFYSAIDLICIQMLLWIWWLTCWRWFYFAITHISHRPSLSIYTWNKSLKALVNIVVDRLKKNRTVLADLYNYVQVDE